MTTPTPDMPCQFQPTIFPGDPAPPLLNATIMHANSPASVDIEIVAGNGTAYLQQDVPLLQVGEPALPGGCFVRMLT